MAAVVLLLATPAAAAAGSGPSTPTPSRSAVAPKSHATTPTTTKATAKTKTTATTKTTPQTTTPAVAKLKPKKVAAKPKKKKKPKPLVPLSGWLGAGAKFPAKSLILSVPRRFHVRPSQVHVSENGTPVTGFSLTPLAQAGVGDFGFVVAIDDSPSVTTAELSQELKAGHALAAQRRGAQALGLIGFGAPPAVLLPLTSNSKTIAAALGTTPPTVPGADTSAAAKLALQQLSHEAAGAVVVISDGHGVTSPDAATRATEATAAAAHIQVVTVGLQDHAATTASLAALKRGAPGPFVSMSGAALQKQVSAMYASVTTGYVVRYRSRMHPGQAVAVSATVDGTKGAVTSSYTVPTPHASRVAKPTKRAPAAPSLANASSLSPAPSFAAPPASPAPVAGGFWNSASSSVVIAVLTALLVGVAIMLIVNRPSKRAVRTRVGSFTAPVLATNEPDDAEAESSLLVRILEKGGFWPKFVLDVDISRSPRTPAELLKRAMIMGTVAAVLIFLVTGTPLFGLLTLVATPLVLRSLIARAARKQRALFRELLPMHLQDLSGAMRAGRSVVGALAAVAAGADEPIKTELDRAVRDEQLGLPLEESLEAIARRMDADDMDQVALVAALNRRSGSNVAEALDRVAEGARERADLRREVKALTGQAKMSSWVLTGMPPLLLIGITIIAPIYAHPLLHTPIGLGLLTLSALMVFSGWKVMGKIINVKV